MLLHEGRRLTGPNLWLPGPGAAVEVALQPQQAEAEAIAAWQARVTQACGWLGWQPRFAVHRHQRGATLALTAPIDLLHTAVEIAEWAVSGDDPEGARPRLVAMAEGERNPRLLQWTARAAAEDLPCLWDDDALTIGMGAHGRTWPLDQLPDPTNTDTAGLQAIPTALITGTNGKTTTARLLARMVRLAGLHVGSTTTDGLCLDEQRVEPGDWTGPGGARKVLRDPAVQAAVLETARGGLLRRGLAVDHAASAVVTNVTADHLGEWGVDDIDRMAEAKLLVRKGLRPGGALVLNASDPATLQAADRLGLPDGDFRVVWFSLDPTAPRLQQARDQGGETATWEDDQLVVRTGDTATWIARVGDVPLTFAGAARHNVDNALAAILAARGLGLDLDAIRQGLAGFRPSADDNPGRANVFRLQDATAIVDFAHNPDGVAHIASLIDRWPSRRRVILLGQAGDRSDEAIRQLVDVAMTCRPDRYILKESEHYLRGRTMGEVSRLIFDHLRARGVPEPAIECVADEHTAVAKALAERQPGDLLILLVHDDFAAAVEQLRAAGAEG